MPDMDGIETAGWIRKRSKSEYTPIIFVTADDKSRDYVEKGYSLSAVDYLFKPIVPIILKTTVSVFVKLYRKNRQAEIDKERLTHLAEELKRSNAELEQFAYMASHDLQEPLRKIKSFTELFAKRYQGQIDEKADQYIYYITDGAHRMQKLISGLLAYSRIKTQWEPIKLYDFNVLVHNVLDAIQLRINETGTSITVDKLPLLKANPIQISQVFQNLILNAIKFAGRKPPSIHISAKGLGNVESRKAAPASSTTFDKWQFSVSDNGIGIDPVYSERIFRIFQRLNLRSEYAGEGMRLAMCKKIVERHGGKIWVESDGPEFSTKERSTERGMGLGLSTTYNIVKNHNGFILVESEKDSGTAVTIFLPAEVSVMARPKY